MKMKKEEQLIKIIKPYLKISKIEKCSKCGAFREWAIYETGMKEKKVWSLRGIKCNHKWRDAISEEIGDLK